MYMHTHVPVSIQMCVHTDVCVHTCTQVNVINSQRIIFVERNHLIFNSYRVDLATIFLYLVDTMGESDI